MLTSIIQEHKKFLCSYSAKRWLRESLAEKYSEGLLKAFSEYVSRNLRETKSAETMLITHGFKKVVNGSTQPFRLFYFGKDFQLVLFGLQQGTIESTYPEKIGDYDGVTILSQILQEIRS